MTRPCCMICGLPKNDSPSGGEEDQDGNYWTYCRDCDAWTAHPPAAHLTPDKE
jgi:hypothetical protein